MSIGQVLKVLREEFPDVTISKIRFLEAEGLIEPERSTSGYRRFSSIDAARLRYILQLQRDHFMPLKVIRHRLDTFDAAAQVRGNEPTGQDSGSDAEPVEAFDAGVNLSFDELVSSSGMDADHLHELEEYGLIDAHPLNGGVYYDEDDLLVARIARDFGKYGVEPRHLRMYRHFAERELALFEQIVLPRSRSAVGDGRRAVAQSLTELSKLSKTLKHLLLRAYLREHL